MEKSRSSRVTARFTYANVTATVALFFALSGATAIGATALLTGADIQNGSLTGADVKKQSIPASKLKQNSLTSILVRDQALTGADLKDGSVRAADFDRSDLDLLRGAQGPAGPKGDAGPQGPQGPQGAPGSSDIERLAWSAPDVSGYVDGTPLIDRQVSTAGGWLMFALLDVTNTSGVDDWFNCGLVVEGRNLGGGGEFVPAGTTREIIAIAFGPADANGQVTLVCGGGGVGASFDIAEISMSLAKLM